MIPSTSNPKWAQLIKGDLTYDYKFLALKIVLTRLQQKFKYNSAELPTSVDELNAFFTKHQALLADDIKMIFG